MIKITTAALICGAASTPLLAAGSRGGAAQPPLHAADFSVFEEGAVLDLFLLVGQSNMKGRGLIEPKPVTNERNLFFHPREQQWFVSRDPLHSAGTPDLIDGSDNAGTGPGMSFAMTLLKKDPKLAIGLIPAAVGGASINAYKKDLFERSLMFVAKGREQSPIRTEIKAILWLQGESDSTEGGYTSYEAKLLDLVDRYRAELKNPELPFIACTIGSFIHPHKRFTRSREINEILLKLPSKRKHTACIDARDLKVTTGDKLHYGKESQIEIGRRFAATYLELVENGSSISAEEEPTPGPSQEGISHNELKPKKIPSWEGLGVGSSKAGLN